MGSPVVTSHVDARTEAKSPLKLAVKAKAHATLNSSGAASPSSTNLSEPQLDFAEKLNEDTASKYLKGTKLGEGTYATVFKATLRKDPSKLFAIKKIKISQEPENGLDRSALAEIRILQELSHPNIVGLHDVFSSGDNLNLVLEHLPRGDLEELIRDHEHIVYGAADIKTWMGMLVRAVWFCHENFVLHRDIKPNNLLFAADGEMKLADFGLARSFADPYSPMSHQVITRWYRPPELFYKARYYSGAVDIWSVGTVFAELILRNPFLAGNTDLHQLELISQNIGTPTEDNWPGVSKLEDFVATPKDKVIPVKGRQWYTQLFGSAGPAGVELMMAMLKLDPRKRITARQILQHEWWSQEPKPRPKEQLPRKQVNEKKMGEALKRRGGEVDGLSRGDKVAKKLDFGSAR